MLAVLPRRQLGLPRAIAPAAALSGPPGHLLGTRVRQIPANHAGHSARRKRDQPPNSLQIGTLSGHKAVAADERSAVRNNPCAESPPTCARHRLDDVGVNGSWVSWPRVVDQLLCPRVVENTVAVGPSEAVVLSRCPGTASDRVGLRTARQADQTAVVRLSGGRSTRRGWTGGVGACGAGSAGRL